MRHEDDCGKRTNNLIIFMINYSKTDEKWVLLTSVCDCLSGTFEKSNIILFYLPFMLQSSSF
jgi:hypothetical protein